MKSRRVWILTGTIVLGSVVAQALPELKGPYPTCTSTPSEADRRAAQGAFFAGEGSFKEADYATAIIYWRDAYRRDCTAHALLINLARAYELRGDRAEAVNALEIYLQRKPDAPDAEQIQRRIQNLKAQINPQPTVAPPPSTAPVAPVASAPPQQAVASPPQGSRSIVPLIVAGTGAAVGVVGLAVLLDGQSKVSNAEDLCGKDHTQCPSDDVLQKGNDGRAQMTPGAILMGAGIAGAAGGVVWYLFFSPRKPNPTSTGSDTRLQPVVTPGFAGVSLGGSF